MENEKITTTSNFQTMAIKSSIMPASHIFNYKAFRSFMMAKLPKVP